MSEHNDKLVEINCPYSQRFMHPTEAADSQQWRLRKTHQYCAQVQGQLGAVGLHCCDFVVYITKGIHVVSVPSDIDYCDSMRDLLSGFIDKYYIPYVLQ